MFKNYKKVHLLPLSADHVVLVKEAGGLEVLVASIVRAVHRLGLSVHDGVSPEGLGLGGA